MSAQEALNGTLFEGSIKGGTPQLFSTKEMLSPKARYPRGYTPERQREVHQNGPIVWPPQQSGSASERSRMSMAPVRRVRDNLARSAVPMGGEMRDTIIETGVEFAPNHITGGQTAGQYHAPREGYGKAHRIMLAHGQEDNPTLIHEIGHLDSFATGRGHSSYRTQEAKGAEEAYADDFAVRNFRDRRGRTPNPSGGYAKSVEAGKTDPAFARQYRTSRQTHIERTQAQLDRHPLLPPGHVPGQVPLLDGSMTGNHEAGDERVKWDYTAEQKAAGVSRETDEAYLSPRAAQSRAARLPKGTKVNRDVEWSSGAVRRASN